MTERVSVRAVTGLVVLMAVLPAVAMAQERYAIGGDHIAIYNLAGAVALEGTSGGQVTVEVARGGRDGSALEIDLGMLNGRQTLRVMYPASRVVYGARGWSGSTTLRVRPDGTWGGRSGMSSLRGQAVRIAGSGRGLEAHADLRIGVPRGQRVEIYLAVGRITAENVNGRVRLDTHSGAVTVRNMVGRVTIDTGSGRVEATDVDGDLHIDTGSGGVRVAGVRGDRVHIDTGSGRVVASDVTADRLVIDTGSGGIDLRGAVARDIRLDTGSGSVRAEVGGPLDRLVIDTGSGSVTLRVPTDVDAALVVDTGSGRISVDLPMRVARQGRSELRGTLGEGRGSIRIDTGSGSVRVQAL